MPAMQSNKLAKGAHARVVSRRLVCVFSGVGSHRFERSLPEQAVDKRQCGCVIEHEPVIARQRYAKSAQVSQTVA